MTIVRLEKGNTQNSSIFIKPFGTSNSLYVKDSAHKLFLYILQLLIYIHKYSIIFSFVENIGKK